MILKKKEFLSVLEFLKPTISVNNRIQILQSISFSGTHGLSFNGSIGSSIEFETEVPFVIPFDRLYVFVKGAKQDIEIEIDKNLAYLQSGNSTSELPLSDISDYPEIAIEDDSWPIPDDFITAISKCSAFSSRRSSRMELQGVYVKESDIYATDGMRIAHALLSDNANENGIVIPNDFVKVIAKQKFDEVFFDESKGVFFNRSEGKKVFGNIIDGSTFPNVGKFMPKVTNFIELPREELKSALVTVGNFTGDVIEDAECVLNITDKEINVSYEGESANIYEVFDFGNKLPKGKYSLNPFHFSVLLDNCKKFSFEKSLNIIYGESEDSNFSCVLALHQEK